MILFYETSITLHEGVISTEVSAANTVEKSIQNRFLDFVPILIGTPLEMTDMDYIGGRELVRQQIKKPNDYNDAAGKDLAVYVLTPFSLPP